MPLPCEPKNHGRIWQRRWSKTGLNEPCIGKQHSIVYLFCGLAPEGLCAVLGFKEKTPYRLKVSFHQAAAFPIVIAAHARS